MKRFLRIRDDLINDTLINVDQIKRIEHGDKRGPLAILVDGTTVTLSAPIDTIEQALHPVVAATPGYTLLSYYLGADENGASDGGAGVIRLPIVAWRIRGDYAVPITPDGAGHGFASCILLPDGQAIEPCMSIFADERGWRDEVEEKAAQRPKVAG